MLTTAQLLKLNNKPSKPDARDRKYIKQNVVISDEVDLRPWDSPIEDQGSIGSCVSQAVTSAYELMVKKNNPDIFSELSRLFVYYHSRFIEGNVNEDSGISTIRDALNAVRVYGVCSERLWPYDLTKVLIQPPPPCYVDAFRRKISQYTSLYSLSEMQETLVLGKPIVIGLNVFNGFMNVTQANPVVPLPASTDEVVIGGHAMVILGYSNKSNTFLVKNSFGIGWGDRGYGWLPYEYIRMYTFEKWCFDLENQSTG